MRRARRPRPRSCCVAAWAGVAACAARAALGDRAGALSGLAEHRDESSASSSAVQAPGAINIDQDDQGDSGLSLAAILAITVSVGIFIIVSIILVFKCRQGAQQEADYEAIKAERAERYERSAQEGPESQSLLRDDGEDDRPRGASAAAATDTSRDFNQSHEHDRPVESDAAVSDADLRELARRQALQKLDSSGFLVDQY